MQLYGLDENRPISALKAERQKKYLCPECLKPLRIRGGPHRQIHFYHIYSSTTCSQHRKGIIHLRIQELLKNILNGSEMEKHYPSIGRIADVAWPQQRMIFEIQYSPISLKEVQERTVHYKSLGLQPVWILHDQRFNQRRLSPAEFFLRSQECCYFTNIDQQGNGEIYDQFECLKNFKRIFKGKALAVDLSQPKKVLAGQNKAGFPEMIKKRLESWPIHCEGDLLDRSLKETFPEQFYSMLALEKRLLQLQKDRCILSYAKHFYLSLIRFLLEALSK